jgi:non-canonical purine NTP pyrophosphatase (RdgB/HAM1 family)
MENKIETIYFVTGNKDKLKEIKLILPEIKQFNIDLLEIQEVNAKKIIKFKLQGAMNYKKARFIVEDTSLYLECLNGLPGPLIKWFLVSIGNNGLVNLAEKLGNNKAKVKTIIGYAKNSKDIYFFEKTIKGKIVKQKGKLGFGWDSIFLPDKHLKTFSEMTQQEKNKISMRGAAAKKLKRFIKING